MEKVRRFFDEASLKKCLVVIFSTVIIMVTIISIVTIVGLASVQKNIMNSRGMVIETSNENYTKTDSGYVIKANELNGKWLPLSTEKKVIYYGSIVAMVAIPILCIILGVYLGSLFYYNVKLKTPIGLLKNGVNSLTDSDLDFKLDYHKADEMGELCGCFDTMRSELRKNQYKINKLSEERKILIASVAHDVRTPLMVIKGYNSYLYKKQDDEEIKNVIVNMESSIERLESYVECIRNIQNLDELEIHKEIVLVNDLVQEMNSDFQQLFRGTGLLFKLESDYKESNVNIDQKILFRILENIISNSKRFANTKVLVKVKVNDTFEILVEDDGPGFSKEILQNGVKPFGKTDGAQNWGLGLYISKILVEKLDGQMLLGNGSNVGALVKIRFSIN